MVDQLFLRWLTALEERHMANLRFVEVSRALRALSSAYVERRHRLASGTALSGAGKRAGFALLYGPLHYLTVVHILRHLPAPVSPVETIVDLGCGTGAAGAAWAAVLQNRPSIVGIERHPWAVAEASWTYRCLGLRGRVQQGDVTRARLLHGRTGVVAGWLANELDAEDRQCLLERLLDAHAKGAAVLIVEPIARAISPWWDAWALQVTGVGGRADEWRFPADLPDLVRRLDHAAGLSHATLTARSLWLGGSQGNVVQT